MAGNVLSRALAMLLICQLVSTTPASASGVTIHTPKSREEAERQEAEPRKKSSLIEPDNPTNQPPINPMILPKNHRQHLRLPQRDSYLNALQYSHTMLHKDSAPASSQKQQPARRDYTPGPVYRGDNSSSGGSGSGTGSGTGSTGTGGGNNFDIQGKISRISTYNPSSNSYQPTVVISPHEPQSTYETYETYSSPPSYSQPQSFNSYGAPSNSYGQPPSGSYGQSPSSSYGHPTYGAPPPSQGLGSLQATYSTSYPLPDLFPLTFLPAIDLSWPISLKLNAFTLIKIVLKIIVFKMMVKFIATICLLLFLPKIMQSKPEPSSNDDEDESRKFNEKPSKKRLHVLKSMVTESVELYESMNKNNKEQEAEEMEKEKGHKEGRKSNEEPCTTIGCKIRNKLLFLSNGDTWEDYLRLFKSYVAEEERLRTLGKSQIRNSTETRANR